MKVSSVSPDRCDITDVQPVVGHVHRLESLGQRTDLADLDQDRVLSRLRYLGWSLGVGDEQVVSNELTTVAHEIGVFSSRPSLSAIPFDRHDRIPVAQRSELAGHLS